MYMPLNTNVFALHAGVICDEIANCLDKFRMNRDCEIKWRSINSILLIYYYSILLYIIVYYYNG